ncbi:MAG: fluoride efflux transporter CrcB [Chloroflexi bacterium HGW-Chloroflexi-4]|nr:MAG: fluoride efflux transporter CrcB [Chloroflexi bacterium HGW-Chloroflexi-4]
MRDILIIGAGGFIGAVLRYLAILSMQLFKTKTQIPMGTLLVNVAGCLLIGFLAVMAENSKLISTDTRNFLVVGILGAFTTFSTFGYESVFLLKHGLNFHFALNILLQLVLGFAAVWGGMALARLFQIRL